MYCEPIDDYTMYIKTDEPNASTLLRLNYIKIIPKHYVEQVGDSEFNAKPIGSGPYRMVEWNKDASIKLEAFSDYFGTKPAADELICKVIPEASARIAALEAGEVDLISAVTTSQISRLNSLGNIEVVSKPTTRTVYYTMNSFGDSPVTDLKVRQAINMAIDKDTLVQGVLDGYQTMDALAALNFGAVIALNLQAVGITEESAVRRGTIRAGFIAGGMLLAVYAMLTHIGGISEAAFPGSDTGAAVLTALADGLFGRVGQVLLAAIFVIACFNTCVGLIASVGEYFHELLPRLPYPAIAAFFALMSMLLANIGLAGILSLSVPVLNAIYPIAIILIVVEFLPGRFQRTSVWRLSILFTAIQSIPAALPFGPLSTLMNALPLSSLGFGWLLPALIGIGAGLLM